MLKVSYSVVEKLAEVQNNLESLNHTVNLIVEEVLQMNTQTINDSDDDETKNEATEYESADASTTQPPVIIVWMKRVVEEGFIEFRRYHGVNGDIINATGREDGYETILHHYFTNKPISHVSRIKNVLMAIKEYSSLGKTSISIRVPEHRENDFLQAVIDYDERSL